MSNLPTTGPVALVLSKLEKVRPAGKEQWTARCPAHKDREPSLSIAEGRDGRALLTCHTGCSLDSIIGALGLEMADLFPEPSPTARGFSVSRPAPRPPIANRATAPRLEHPVQREPAARREDDREKDDARSWPVVATYDYADPDGRLVFQVLRKEPPVQPADGKRKKTFSQRRPDPAGGWINNISDLHERPLYRMPELIDDLAAERTILLVEGEKDCITLRELGLPATTHSGGAKGWRPEYAHQLAGASVIILPDNDEPGRKWAADAGAALIEQGATVRMCAVPVHAVGADVTDWVQSGGTLAQLERLLDRAIAWQPGDPVPVPAAPPKFKLLSVADLENLPPMDWLVGEERAGIFPAEALLGVFGAPGCGKSFVAADLACTIACRRDDLAKDWFGNTIRRGPVLYVAAEGGRGFRSRIIAWRDHHGVAQHELALYFVLEPVNLYGSDDVSHILRTADLLPEPPALVVFDTLARSMVGGDDNSAQDIGMVIDRGDRVKRETGASVLFNHHATKEGNVERGSGALRAGVDTLCSVREDEDGTARVISCEKQKDADNFPDITFYLHTVGDSCVVRSEPPRGPVQFTKSHIKALKTLQDVFGTTGGATATEWQQASGVPASTFFRVRGFLTREGYVSSVERSGNPRYSISMSGRAALTRTVV